MLAKVLQVAGKCHEAGQLREAENFYQEILKAQPNHAEANFRMGLLAQQTGRGNAALIHFQAALKADLEQAQYWMRYIDALLQAGQTDAARGILDLGRRRGLAGDDVDRLAARLTALTAPVEPEPVPAMAAAAAPVQSTPVAVAKKPLKAAAGAAGKGPASKQKGPSAEDVSTLVAMYNERRFADMEVLAKNLIMRYPQHGFGWKSLAALLQQQGRLKEALAPAQRAAMLLPEDAEAHNNLGIVLRSQGRAAEAEASYRRAVTLKPDFAQAHNNLGNILIEQGRPDDAISSYRDAIGVDPGFADAYCNLGQVLKEEGLLTEAENCFRQAIRLRPNFLDAFNNLGHALYSQGRLAESEACYNQALSIKPDYAEALVNLGECLRRQMRLPEAEQQVRRALIIKPNLVEGHNGLASILRDTCRLGEAETSLRNALQYKPDNFAAYNNLGMVLQDQSRLDEAIASYRHALALKPDYKVGFGNLLFALNYHPDKSAEEIFEEYREFDARFGLPHQKEWRSHGNSRDTARRLKIGYVSPDFREHPACRFLEPLMAHHDRMHAVEVFAYAELAREDAATARYKTYADHWIPTKGMTDAMLAERIRADGIDILVDLAGQTANNRLGVFARKPAPVSMSWLGYGYTSGLSAIDYMLADHHSVPSGSDGLFAERPWRMDRLCYVYRPSEGMGPVNALPAAQRGYVTFGTLTRAVRINHRTIRVWAEMLKRVPNSRLIINSANFKMPSMQAKAIEKFAAHGIEAQRLEIGYQTPPWDVLRSMDIGLDCFPHNSGTTLFESLYMGLPYVTLAGRPSVGRLGGAILAAAGHPEWIAYSEEEYVEKAVQLASDLPRLAELRARLRPEMQASEMMDEPGFTRSVEAAYREMFKAWSERQS